MDKYRREGRENNQLLYQSEEVSVNREIRRALRSGNLSIKATWIQLLQDQLQLVTRSDLRVTCIVFTSADSEHRVCYKPISILCSLDRCIIEIAIYRVQFPEPGQHRDILVLKFPNNGCL